MGDLAFAYRSNIVAADLCAAPGVLTTSVVNGGGLTTATLYKSKVVGGNVYGRTTGAAGTDRTASSPNLTLRILFAGVTGITFFDIYVSIDTDPKWVGRITEAQRASGIKITAVGVTGAGGTPGGVDVEVPGTGLQSLVTAAENTAYAIPTTIVVQPQTWPKEYVDFDLALSRTGDAVALSLTVVPFFKNSLDGTYYLGDHKSLVFGGQSGVFQAMQQRLRVELKGHPLVGLLVAKIAGTGASLTIKYSLS
jgi:hypothetical protein